jgi:mannose-1-phosphate guanylyltransferase / mannose-6-phosphate isomerase
MIFPVVLCGGSGTRLWPLSRTLLPKQFLPLVTSKTMLQETLLRLGGMARLQAPLVVCSNDHRFLAAEQLREIGVTSMAQILEPAGRNTAPAVAVAALCVADSDPQGIMLVLPADHLIRDVAGFHEAAGKAATLAGAGRLVTFGIVAREPETGYGYIERGEAVPGTKNAYRVARFVEKPDVAHAREFIASGRFYWNSGMFVIAASRYLEELGKYRPDILKAAKEAWSRSTRDLDFVRLDETAFLASPAESID